MVFVHIISIPADSTRTLDTSDIIIEFKIKNNPCDNWHNQKIVFGMRMNY